MQNYTEKTYGDRIAAVYDQWYSEFEQAMITVLVELAQGGEALELGVGTGRIAIPLHEAGIPVHGVDASESMVAKLRAKPGGKNIAVTFGNFVDLPVEGKYSLIYVVFNTFFSLLTQEEQVNCFQSVAKHLKPHGVFVIEAFVPDMTRFMAEQSMRVTQIQDKEVQIDVSQLDKVTQVITSQHVLHTEQGNQFFPVKIRYAWPTEMDLMARLAHLCLRERWGSWEKEPFTNQSRKHISIYEHERV